MIIFALYTALSGPLVNTSYSESQLHSLITSITNIHLLSPYCHSYPNCLNLIYVMLYVLERWPGILFTRTHAHSCLPLSVQCSVARITSVIQWCCGVEESLIFRSWPQKHGFAAHLKTHWAVSLLFSDSSTMGRSTCFAFLPRLDFSLNSSLTTWDI